MEPLILPEGLRRICADAARDFEGLDDSSHSRSWGSPATLDFLRSAAKAAAEASALDSHLGLLGPRPPLLLALVLFFAHS